MTGLMEHATPATPDTSSRAIDLLLEMDHRRGTLRRELQCTLRAAIQDGRLATGTRLPSSRLLAADLRVSRGVVADSYDQLAAEGYLTMLPRQAPLVAGVANTPPCDEEDASPAWRIDFRPSSPDIELFPRRAWLRATERVLRGAPNAAMDYGDHRGQLELRRSLSTYLARVRGVRVGPERIVVTQGFTQALDLIGRVLAARGATAVAFESPSLPSEWATLRASGLQVLPCPVDADGLVVERLHALPVAAVVVTPAHQYPTGAVMSPSRRMALLAWAAGGDRLIIEDDYDAEFRYDHNAVGAIQGLDPDRVVHIGTASKTLAPGVRLAWMSLPAGLVDEVREAKALADSGSPAIDQLAMAELLQSGDYDRSVARARHVYRERRDLLVRSLARRLPSLPVRGAAAGLHVLLSLPDHSDDVGVVAAAAERGINLTALSPMAQLAGPERGLLLGYGRMAPDRIDAAVAELSASIAAAGLSLGQASSS